VRRIIEAGGGLLGAFLVFTLLHRIHPLAVEVVNVFVAVVLLAGLLGGEITGAVMGAVCGLVADSFSVGIFGIAGLALTTMGFYTGFVSRKINVLKAPRLFVFFVFMAGAELVLWSVLTALVFGGSLPWSGGLLLVQPVVNALAATALYGIYRRGKARHGG
jgi:cell shape-determining protein MreD